MQLMVVRTKDEARREFAKNLNEALDKESAPRRGRPGWLRSRLGNIVSRETCRKWLAADDMPDQAHLSVLVDTLGLNAQQLRTGEWDPPPGAKDERLVLLTKSWPGLADETRRAIMNVLALDKGSQSIALEPRRAQKRRRA